MGGSRPLELERDRGQTILVLEDPGGELLGGLLGTPMEVGDFLRIAVGVAAALAKVHPTLAASFTRTSSLPISW